MFKLNGLDKMTEEQRLKYMLTSLKGQLSLEKDPLANLSNASAIIKSIIDDLNWAGFYFVKKGELILGPFQGLPACNRIKLDTGVCGAAVRTKEIQVVANVHKFPGHIACDSASNSELVIPIMENGLVYGVLDLDSPKFNRFTELEARYFQEFVDELVKHIDFDELTKVYS